MSRLRIWQTLLSVLAVLSAIPGAQQAAKHFEAYELIWMIPFLPAFTVTFFWITITMVRLFIQADSYKNPQAIAQAKWFLAGFDRLFLIVLVLFTAASAGIYCYWKA